MKRAAPRRRRKQEIEPPFYYLAMVKRIPRAAEFESIEWFKAFWKPPDVVVLRIDENGNVDINECHLSRGLGKHGSDWVCWFNEGTQKCTVQFTNGRWPFSGPKPQGEKFDIAPSSPSKWYRLSPSSGNPGESIRFGYGVDVGPGPPGPEVVSDD